VSRRYARNNAEAARLGIPTYYQAHRSKEAAEARGLPQSLLRGHPRRDRGEASLTEVRGLIGGLFGAGLRPMLIVSGGQAVTVTPATKAQASMIGAYHNAIKKYFDSGDTSDLARFRGRTVAGFELDAEPDDLDDLARTGQLDVETIYTEVAA